MNKTVLITGISGQDGSYLAELLLYKNYHVHGIIRRSSSFNTGRIEHLYDDPNTHRNGQMVLHYSDLTDSLSILRLIAEIRPDEIYNLAAQSHVKVSFEQPEYTANVAAIGAMRILDCIKTLGMCDKIKFYQASTSEMYGNSLQYPQTELTPFSPCSPYATAKLFAYWATRNYRQSYGIFACNGIMFNHESPRRGETFVTRKITRAVAKIHIGILDCVRLGNLDAERDWGHAKDYVEAMWLMLQQEHPDDYVIATGESHSVREFVELAFRHIGMKLTWSGSGVEEVGTDEDGRVRVRVDPKFFRPTEVSRLCGDYSKAKRVLEWSPRSSFADICREMVESDIELMKKSPHK